MVGLKIGLDIGTGYVTAAVEGKGVVLCEPAVVALERETGKVLEAGTKAAEMTGRCPDAIKLVRPLLSGGVSELESSEKLLRNFYFDKNFDFCFSKPSRFFLISLY